MKRESRYVKVARIAYHLAKEGLPRYSHPKSPHRFTFPQLAACVLLMFYVNKSYREMEEWLLASDQVVKVLELEEIPDHTTLQRTYRKLSMKDFERMKEELLRSVGVGGEEGIAADSTGFSPSNASLLYLSRCGRVCHRWVKGVYAVGTRSLYILAWRYGYGPGNEAHHLNGLRRDVRRYAFYQGGKPAWQILADSGFDGKTARPGDLIPLRREGKSTPRERRIRSELVAQARLEGWYGQRWKVETVNSVIKRLFGSFIRSHRSRLQMHEPIIKALLYNIHL
jgi:Transposase DDE domain